MMKEVSREELQREIQQLHDRLEAAEETLRAIREGEVDAIVVSSPQGDRVFTLEGADYPYRVFVEGMKEGAATVDTDGMILYCNNRFASLLKQRLEQVIGTNFKQFLSPLDQQLFQSLSQQADVEVGKGEFVLIASDKTHVFVQVAMSRLKLNNDVNCLIITDLTEQKRNEAHIKASLKEKEVLLKEIHHRVKNNLQIVSSLLQMQSRRTNEQQAALVLQDSQNRIASIALVHEKLYRSENLARINFSQYIPDLTIHLFDSYSISSDTITLNFKVDEIFLEIETAIPCGLMINELISNALKYAFPEQRKGEILIEFYANPEGTLTLIVRDNGIGMPAEFNLENPTSLGLTLIQGLVEQLEGTIKCDRHQGTEFRITFPAGNNLNAQQLTKDYQLS